MTVKQFRDDIDTAERVIALKESGSGTEYDRPARPKTGSNSITEFAFKGMVGGVLTLLAGLVNQFLVAAMFGAGAEIDAFLTAGVIPNYLAYVLISGLSFVLIPAFVHEEESGTKENAWALVGTCLLVTVGTLLIFATAGSILARQVIDLTAPGFQPEKAELAAKMLGIMMFTVPCIGLQSLSIGIQNARNRFFWPSVANGIGSIGNVITIFLFYPRVGPIVLAWGNLLSSILAALIPTLPILRHGWRKLLPLTDTRILKLAVLIIPFILLGLVMRSSGVLERYFASNLPDGDLSYLGYANRISGILVVLLAGSIASATFPMMARQFAQHGNKGLIEQTEYSLRLTFATALPVLAISGALALPLIMVLFERGAFSHDTSINVSRILFIVILGDLFFRMLGNVISRAYFVIEDTLTLSLLNALGIVAYVPAAKLLTDEWGYVGLALAMPIQSCLTNMAAFFILERRLRYLNLRRLGKFLMLYVIASLAGAFCTWGVSAMLAPLSVILQLVFGLLSAGFTYLAILLEVDREIAIAILEMIGVRKIFQRVGLINADARAVVWQIKKQI